MTKKIYGYWRVKVHVLDDAKRFQTVSKWRLRSPGAYASGSENGWMAEAAKHMSHRNKWTNSNLIADAKKYANPSAWKRASASAYATAVRLGCRKECCASMDRIRKPNGYWTKQRCIESARKYDTITEWQSADGGACDAARRNRWFALASKHLLKTYSNGEFSIRRFLLQYDILFEHQKRFDDLKDKSYLYFDFFVPDYKLLIEFHGQQHFKVSKSSRYKERFADIQRHDKQKKKYAKRQFEFLEISSEKTTEIEAELMAALKEIDKRRGAIFKFERRELRAEEVKSLATMGRWTREKVLTFARTCKAAEEWIGSPAYQAAAKYGWLADARTLVKSDRTPRGYWTKERCMESAKNYSTKKAWAVGCAAASMAAWKKGWHSECRKHMKQVRQTWTLESCRKSARNFQSRKDWSNGAGGAYNRALREGWMSSCCVHMQWFSTKKPPS